MAWVTIYGINEFFINLVCYTMKDFLLIVCLVGFFENVELK